MRGAAAGTAGRNMRSTPAVGAAAMRALLGEPDSWERSGPGALHTAIPTGTTLRRLSITGGTATVDLSSRFAAPASVTAVRQRIGQVVYTLTQFPSVKRVRFRIGGVAVTKIGAVGLPRPVTRADLESVTAMIHVEHPVPWLVTPPRFTFSGTADVFEAQFNWRVERTNGRVVAAGSAHASSGAPVRGRFAAPVNLGSFRGVATFVAYDVSEGPGTEEIGVVRVPIVVVD